MTSARIVDAQVHTWTLDSVEFPWSRSTFDQLPDTVKPRYETDECTSEALLAMMDDVGVDVALLTSPWLYGSDHSYALAGTARYPSRFAAVVPFDLAADDLSERVHSLVGNRSVVGARLLLAPPAGDLIDSDTSSELVDLVAVVAESGWPVFLSPMGRFDRVAALARAFPATTFVLDHLGLWLNATIERRLALVDELVTVRALDNVALKCSALPELSREPYPYEDLWPMLHRVIDAFGVDRLMWGSDINQHRDLLSYDQSLEWIRASNQLGAAEKQSVLGGTACRLIPGLTELMAATNSGGGRAST